MHPEPAARPTPEQIAWHDMELELFVHFGPRTWRHDIEKLGPVPADRLDPDQLDVLQWIDVAKSLGAGQIVLVAKHVDGYCWWQTSTSDYGVRQSPWRHGSGDLVADLAAQSRNAGLKLGIYLSPADQHLGAAVSGRCATAQAQTKYSEVYREQLRELLVNYGEISEVWFDGSNVIQVGDILAAHAPHAMVFQGPHATIRWPGNEDGFAPYPAWNSVQRHHAATGIATAAHGDPDGDVWMPLEMDTTLRKHYWFHQPDTEHSIKSLDYLMETYYRSVGHGSVLLLNSNPDTSGLIPDPDARATAAFGTEVRRRFGAPVADAIRPRASDGHTYEMLIEPGRMIDHLVSTEEIAHGERVRSYRLEGYASGRWSELATGSAIGHKKIDFFPRQPLERVRLTVLDSGGQPYLKRLSAYDVGETPSFDRNDVRVHDPLIT